jgi:hypothetical protein
MAPKASGVSSLASVRVAREAHTIHSAIFSSLDFQR